MAGARVVAVLTRAPASGGKTRLFTALGRECDPALLTALLLDTLDGLAAPGVRRVVAVDPASRCAEVRAIVPDSIGVFGQPAGSLGERMRAIMTQLLEEGARSVVLVGSDLREADSRVVTEAFRLLDEDPGALVLGPAADGGYYLIGASRVPDVFAGISWGTSTVLAETVAAAGRAAIRVCLVEPLGDVDTPADLDRVARSPTGRHLRTADWARANSRARKSRAN